MVRYNKNFGKFKEEVLKYDIITIDELYLLINRITHTSKKTFFGFNKNQKFNARLKYHRHWIQMLEGMGVIEQIPNYFQRWKVNRESVRN